MDLSAPGVFVFLDNLSGPELSPFARKVESLGYGVLWYTEGVGRESLSLGTYLLTQTERIVIGSGIAVAFCREPIAAANAARALSELFPGRFILGLGVSNAAGNARRGVGYEPPVTFMRNYLARMKTAPYEAPAPPAETPVVLGSLHPKMIGVSAPRSPCSSSAIPVAPGPLPAPTCPSTYASLTTPRRRQRPADRRHRGLGTGRRGPCPAGRTPRGGGRSRLHPAAQFRRIAPARRARARSVGPAPVKVRYVRPSYLTS